MTRFHTRTPGSAISLALAVAFVFPCAGNEPIPAPPGIVITHSPVSTGRYIGSPSFTILPNGDYLAAHDFFGPGSLQYRRGITRVFGSSDKGATWSMRSEISKAFWSGLFVHRGKVYLLGVDRSTQPSRKEDRNHILIRRSEDHGFSWTNPEDKNSGVLFHGRYGFAPTPVVEQSGRIWRALGSGILSAPAEENILLAKNWTIARGKTFDRKNWLNGAAEGWSEGNAVVGPDGTVFNLAKVRYFQPGDDHAALIAIGPDGKTVSFDPNSDFVKMPGARLKFTVRRDKVTGRYFAMTNFLPKKYWGDRTDLRRNVVALVSSVNLRDWQVNRIILEHPDTEHHGFQYLDWDIEGNDIVGICRTAWPDGNGGPARQHDANYLTFHRIPNFRDPATLSED